MTQATLFSERTYPLPGDWWPCPHCRAECMVSKKLSITCPRGCGTMHWHENGERANVAEVLVRANYR